jgi:hypothetical protein
MKRKAQTKRLTTDERLLIPYLEKILLRTNKENPKFNDEIIKELNLIVDKIKDMNIDISRVSGIRLRKMINYMRCNSLLPIISNSKGYYVSYNIEDIGEMIVSLTWRAEAIEAAATGLREIINQIRLEEKLDNSFLKGIEEKPNI